MRIHSSFRQKILRVGGSEGVKRTFRCNTFQIANLVSEGKALPKPAACPGWLYQLSIKCRHVDPAMRPTTEAIIDTLEKELMEAKDPNRAFL